jgi:hypothetical protein
MKINEDKAIVDATLDRIEHVLIDFRRSIKEGDMVVFDFAGHGRQWEVWK